MYNRYIPQSDGSYRRNRMPEQQSRPGPAPRQAVQPQSQPPVQPRQGISVSSFLKNLLPADFDTGDFLIVLLLLLMAEEEQSDSNTALLTLALYLFL